MLKFIEYNWGLKPLSARSRDNLPNPVQPPGTYVPINGPAIGDAIQAAFAREGIESDAFELDISSRGATVTAFTVS